MERKNTVRGLIISLLILAVLEFVLFATNYTPGTRLYGWDNILPELNFSLNLKRNLFAVWQEYRGVGLLDGMAHAANLVHTIFIFIFSFVLPTSLLRYVFHFLMHFLGGVGIFFLLNRLFRHSQLTTHNTMSTTHNFFL